MRIAIFDDTKAHPETIAALAGLFSRRDLRKCLTLLHGSPGRMASGRLGWGRAPDRRGAPAIPFKANRDRRHHIPKQRYRVTNWAEYDAALRQRGTLTIWFTEEAIAAWRAEPRTTRGGQPHY